MIRTLRTLLPICSIILISALFFLPLFFPVLQIYVSPDSHLSDILHFNYPMKFLLSEALGQNRLPLWTDLIGTGYPPIGEGQIQAFSLINLILFRFFPLPVAFNLQYPVLFSMMAVGMYLVARELGWRRSTALYTGLVYAFSGLHIVKIPHLNCLQALSYVPFLFFLILRMKTRLSSRIWLVMPFLFSQQILQGHYQYVFLTVLFLALYVLLTWWLPEKHQRRFILMRFGIIVTLGIGLSAIQLIPSLEYFLTSGGREGLGENFIGSFGLSHLIQYLNPFALGDSRIGTYPGPVYGLAFLETFPYFGAIPFLLALTSLRWIRSDRWVAVCWGMIAVMFLFVFEKQSPIYFLFTLPPLSWFRVYSRFLAFILFLLVLLSGYMLNRLLDGKAKPRQVNTRRTWSRMFGAVRMPLAVLIAIISLVEIFRFASSYQPILPISRVFEKPELYTHAPADVRMTILPYNNKPWLAYMYSEGWKRPEDYLYLIQSGQPNYGLIHNLPSFSLYAGFLPKKQQRLLYFGMQSSTWDDGTHTATLSALSMNTLRLHNTASLFVPSKLTNPEVTLIAQTDPPNGKLAPFYLYSLSGVKPRYYLTDRYERVLYLDEYKEAAEKPDSLNRVDAYISTDRNPSNASSSGTLDVVRDLPIRKEFRITQDVDAFLVASVYLYPGWQARIDGQIAAVVPANLSGMAVFVPKGTHTVRLDFIPRSLYLGAAISGVTTIIYLIIIGFSRRASGYTRRRTVRKA